MQLMAIKHGTRRCDLKRYVKRVPFSLILRYFDERCLFIILVTSNAEGPLHAYLRHPNCPKKGIFLPFLTDFETEVRHLRIPLPAATVEFLAQTLCDCTSHP